MQENAAAVEEGTQLTAQAGDAFQVISTEVSNVFGHLQQASSAIQELNADTGKMVQSIEAVQTISTQFSSSSQEVSAASEEQNASMEEIAAAAQTLAKMAEDLRAAVASFKR